MAPPRKQLRDETEGLTSLKMRHQGARERAQDRHLKSMRRLAGSVAHSFNNLLSVMLNYSYFIEEEANKEGQADPSSSWQSVRQDAAHIREAANRAIELTHQLLLFARQENVRPEVLDLNRTVDDAKDLIRQSIRQEIEIATSFEAGSWPVLMDRQKLEDVLVALAANASDAMATGGLLLIDTANVTVDEAYEATGAGIGAGHYVRLRVSDTGLGMSVEVAGQALEPFFTTKPKGHGSGLGLAVVHAIVTQTGGSVQIHSELGIGTSVSVLVPAVGAAAQRSESRPGRARVPS